MGLITTLLIGGAITAAADKIGTAISENASSVKKEGKVDRGKKITLENNLSYYKNDDPQYVRDIFYEFGFKNITLVPIPLKHMKTDNTVTEVTIDGNGGYKQDDKVYSNDAVEIKYYSLESCTSEYASKIILAPFSSCSFEDMPYAQAREEISRAGFTNITMSPVYTESRFKRKKIDKVKIVTIDGYSDTYKHTALFKDDPIIIYYYTNFNPENESKNANAVTCRCCGVKNNKDSVYCIKCGNQLKKKISVRNKKCNCCGAPLMIDDNNRIYICEYCGNKDLIRDEDYVEID